MELCKKRGSFNGGCKELMQPLVHPCQSVFIRGSTALFRIKYIAIWLMVICRWMQPELFIDGLEWIRDITIPISYDQA
jgi:hypothetical protein